MRKTVRRKLAAAGAAIVCASPARAQVTQQSVNYPIIATLDPAQYEVRGNETII